MERMYEESGEDLYAEFAALHEVEQELALLRQKLPLAELEPEELKQHLVRTVATLDTLEVWLEDRERARQSNPHKEASSETDIALAEQIEVLKERLETLIRIKKGTISVESLTGEIGALEKILTERLLLQSHFRGTLH